MPRKLLTMRPQRSAAARTFSARCLVCGSGANSCSSVDCATTTASGLLSSCETPASSEPIAAIFSFWCSFSRWRLISSSARRLSRRSRIEPKKKPPVGDLHLGRGQLDRKDLAVGVLRHRLHALADHRRAAPGHVFGAGRVALAVECRNRPCRAGPCRASALRLKPNIFSAAGLNSMMLPVSSMTMMASSEACSMVWRMISLTCASDSERSIASPIASATISSAAFSSSVQSPLDDAVVDGQRSPEMAVREDRDRQEGLDLLLLEILAQEAFDLAGLAGEHLALPDLLGQPSEQRVGIDDRLDDDGRRPGDADRPARPPSRRRSTGRSPGPGSSRSRNRIARWPPKSAPAARATSVDDQLPVRRLAQPPDDARRRDRRRRAWRCRGSMLGGRVSIIACDVSAAAAAARSAAVVGQREDIAFAAHRAQEFRVGRIVLDLLAQPHDADVDGARRFRAPRKSRSLPRSRRGSAAGWSGSGRPRARRIRSWPDRGSRRPDR